LLFIWFYLDYHVWLVYSFILVLLLYRIRFYLIVFVNLELYLIFSLNSIDIFIGLLVRCTTAVVFHFPVCYYISILIKIYGKLLIMIVDAVYCKFQLTCCVFVSLLNFFLLTLIYYEHFLIYFSFVHNWILKFTKF
jgi:hypothetical protein